MAEVEDKMDLTTDADDQELQEHSISDDQNATSYRDGDIVWVKLGPSWWPGEVKDASNVPEELLDQRKPPLLFVKFFDEDNYEYVRSWSCIFPYNCDKKHEFIKKGMAGFRNKTNLMSKFPVDVCAAETKTGGNANILSDPMCLPEKKVNNRMIAELFKSPTPKKNKRSFVNVRGKS